jgi:CRP/FNR family transcriptional regulator, cyclic AMP receptor protein
MTHPVRKPHLLMEHLRDSFRHGELNALTIRLPKHTNVYTSGDDAEMIYFIEDGHIKLVVPTLEGKECLLTICTMGDLFGESCLASLGARLETATAMEDTTIKGIHYRKFLTYLSGHSLYEEIIQYLANRLLERERVIADLVTADSEHRLGNVLLHLGSKLGKKGPFNVRIEHRISHEELSQIVGTTRPRISQFIHKFRNLGLIEISAERFLVIKEQQLADYLTRTA